MVPGFSSLRRDLLHPSHRLANLQEEVKKELEDPHSRYNFGWSHGKEKLESGKPGTHRIVDQIYGLNMSCQNLNLQSSGKLIFEVGLMVAFHCDRYVSKAIKLPEDGLNKYFFVRGVIKGVCFTIFLQQREVLYEQGIMTCSTSTEDDENMSSWCGWHTDHGSLTGLTCAMFMRDAVEIPCPDSGAGLYFRTRTDQLVKVVFGEDEIAYQIGETTEVMSRGYLCATPHFVRAPKGEEASGVDRSTFAFFMQPDWDEKLNFPEEVHIHKELIPPNGFLTFGEYTEKLLDKYYHTLKPNLFAIYCRRMHTTIHSKSSKDSS